MYCSAAKRCVRNKVGITSLSITALSTLPGTASRCRRLPLSRSLHFFFRKKCTVFWLVALCSNARAGGATRSFLGMCRNSPPLGNFLLIGSYGLYLCFLHYARLGCSSHLVFRGAREQSVPLMPTLGVCQQSSGHRGGDREGLGLYPPGRTGH